MKNSSTSKLAAFCKAAETRRRNRIEERAKYRRENYEVYDSEDFLASYLASEHSLEEVLRSCAELVTD